MIYLPKFEVDNKEIGLSDVKSCFVVIFCALSVSCRGIYREKFFPRDKTFLWTTPNLANELQLPCISERVLRRLHTFGSDNIHKLQCCSLICLGL